jgi:polysaccharide biosynthesis protein PslH
MSKDNLRILYVTESLRSPPWTGCVIRTLNICQQLRRLGHVTCAAVENYINEQSIAQAKACSDQFQLFTVADYRSLPPVRGNLIHKYHMHWPGPVGFKVSRVDEKRFQNLLKEHDLVWFHTPVSAIPFGPAQMPPSVMDLDDLTHLKLQLWAEQNISLRFRISARIQAFKWRRIEMAAPSHYTGVAVCSDKDRSILGSASNVYVVPNGFSCPQVKPEWPSPDGKRIGFIGTMTYPPNLEGLKWFAQQVWPLIRSVRPDVRLRIIGTSPPDAQFLHTTEGFEPLGYVEDPGMEFKRWTAMIVPLLVGGGTRIKILEAFSRLCPVVSTSVGAYGLEVEDSKNILLGDTPQHFAKQCLALCEKPETGRDLAEEGWNLFTQKYTWEQIGQRIRGVVKKCLEAK